MFKSVRARFNEFVAERGGRAIPSLLDLGATPDNKELDPIQLHKATPYDQFSTESTNIISPETWEGYKFDGQKILDSGNEQISGNLSLGPKGSNYVIGGISVSENSVSVARIDSTRNIFGRVAQSVWNGALDIKAMINLPIQDISSGMFEVGTDYTTLINSVPTTTSAKLAFQGTPVLNAAVTQQIDENITTGCDLTYIPMTKASITSIGVRGVGQNGSIISGILSRMPDFRNPKWSEDNITDTTFKLNYMKPVDARLNLGTELEVKFSEDMKPASSVKAGYEYKFDGSSVTGSLTSNGDMKVVCQNHSGFSVSIDANALEERYGFGLGMGLTG